MTDEELEKVATAATHIAPGESRTRRIVERWNNVHDDRFTEAATPQVVLALLDRVRKAEAQVKEWEDAAAKFL